MNDIAIVTDTTADIPEDLAIDNNIAVIPLYVGYEGKLYKEGKEISKQDVYNKLESGIKINTSAPPIGDFVNLYENLVNNKKKNLIYSIHLSSKLSGTINYANQAKKFFPHTNIKVIDTKNVTISLGFIALEAARAAKRGLSEEKIDQLIDILIKESKFFGTIENFKYLFSGGRAPFLGKSLGSAIKLKPILTIDKNGKVKLKKFTRSKKNIKKIDNHLIISLAKKLSKGGTSS